MSGSMKSTSPVPLMYSVPPAWGWPWAAWLPPDAGAPPDEHAATPASVRAAPMITKVREARNERLIRSPSTTGTFRMPYPIGIFRPRPHRPPRSPGGVLHIRTDRHCCPSPSRSQQQRTAHHNYVRMLSIGSYHSYHL